MALGGLGQGVYLMLPCVVSPCARLTSSGDEGRGFGRVTEILWV